MHHCRVDHLHGQIHDFEVEHVVRPVCVLHMSLQSTYKPLTTSTGTFGQELHRNSHSLRTQQEPQSTHLDMWQDSTTSSTEELWPHVRSPPCGESCCVDSIHLHLQLVGMECRTMKRKVADFLLSVTHTILAHLYAFAICGHQLHTTFTFYTHLHVFSALIIKGQKSATVLKSVSQALVSIPLWQQPGTES